MHIYLPLREIEFHCNEKSLPLLRSLLTSAKTRLWSVTSRIISFD